MASVLAAGLCSAASVPARAADPGKGYRDGVYLVRLADRPVATHEGTRPLPGRRLDAGSDAVRRYIARLDRRREGVLADLSRTVGAAKEPTVLYEYHYALNGFAARLTGAQAARLASLAGVVSVTRDERLELADQSTDSARSLPQAPAPQAPAPRSPRPRGGDPAPGTGAVTAFADVPRFLGLTGDKGLWSKFPGGAERAGEGMILGVVDSGFDPANPLLQPLPGPRPDAAVIARKWRGGCDAGADPDHVVSCNNKVIGAAYFNEAAEPGPRDSASPLDTEGHGTHTATTAVGNHAVAASIPRTSLGGRLSGMAPAARLAVYKACWGEGSCALADVVAALDKAVADGVDAISMSIGVPLNTVDNPLSVAQFNAAAAGVFIVASAGNAGPGTVMNTPPWVTTVAASLDDTGYRAALTLGDGTAFSGTGAGTAVPSAPLVDAAAAGRKGTDPAQASLCAPDTLDRAKARRRIVICTRGKNARIQKSAEVKRAGGIAMVLANTTDAQELVAEVHSVPTVHVNATDGAAVKAYAAGTGATARLGAVRSVPQRAPEVAGFSSSGPDPLTGGDLLKPDLTAPGVDIAAGVVPGGTNGVFEGGFGLMSGTSMSAPHIAGLALLIRAQHPDWSPMAVKSALMTTAYTMDNQNRPIQRSGADATPLDYGSGHVAPAAALDPGLVYDSTSAEWTDFLCSGPRASQAGDGGSCAAARKIDRSDFNYPSIAVGALTGRQTVTRTVTNVGSTKAVYKAALEVPDGFQARVSPNVLEIEPGASARYTVDFTQTDAVYDAWSFGSVTWSDAHGHHRVRSPLAVQAHQLSVPSKAKGTGTDGSVTLSAQVGWEGELGTRLRGLYADTATRGRLTGTNYDFRPGAPAEGPATAKLRIHVPEGTQLARIALLGEESSQGQDIDMYVYRGGKPVVSSRSGGSEESVMLTEPGDYDVYLNQWGALDPSAALPFTLRTWLVGPDEPAAAATVTPSALKVSAGDRTDITVAWRRLHPRRCYLGVIDYSEGATEGAGRTVLTVCPWRPAT
ncbi:S8 family serine peptidase [Streptomyces sp. BPTC-684]|uniref:S8 family serine peptidase n=1 Tax=Streptomyces sp. BPTC-684 TaxID=3043734 RepID=UPI0024B25EB9|nr:S8 family serine peptidase [Streptomyces sp. BPTC-684]WHM40851.1 S8 family serine peptidase [Streptomyces sp. BPTC-684]